MIDDAVETGIGCLASLIEWAIRELLAYLWTWGVVLLFILAAVASWYLGEPAAVAGPASLAAVSLWLLLR